MKARSRIAWSVVGGLVLLLYGAAETRGWAAGGSRAEEPIPRDQLRQSSPGSWHYVYWYHGIRGK